MKKRYSIIPYETIVPAVNGSMDAITAVLAHYSGYINTLSRRVMYDRSGTPHIYIDEFLKLRIQNKLIQKIGNFRI